MECSLENGTRPRAMGGRVLGKLLGSQPYFTSSKILFSIRPGSSYAPPYAKVPYPVPISANSCLPSSSFPLDPVHSTSSIRPILHIISPASLSTVLPYIWDQDLLHRSSQHPANNPVSLHYPLPTPLSADLYLKPDERRIQALQTIEREITPTHVPPCKNQRRSSSPGSNPATHRHSVQPG